MTQQQQRRSEVEVVTITLYMPRTSVFFWIQNKQTNETSVIYLCYSITGRRLVLPIVSQARIRNISQRTN